MAADASLSFSFPTFYSVWNPDLRVAPGIFRVCLTSQLNLSESTFKSHSAEDFLDDSKSSHTGHDN